MWAVRPSHRVGYKQSWYVSETDSCWIMRNSNDSLCYHRFSWCCQTWSLKLVCPESKNKKQWATTLSGHQHGTWNTATLFLEAHSSKDTNWGVLAEQNINKDTDNNKGFMTAILCNNGQSNKNKANTNSRFWVENWIALWGYVKSANLFYLCCNCHL